MATKEMTATGATIEEAQQAAVAALNAPEDAEIHFEILTAPEKKKFGLFGGKDAEVKAWYEVKETSPAAKKPEKKKPAKQQKTETRAKNDAPKAEQNKPAEKKQKPKKAAVEEVVREPIALEDCPETVKKAYAYLQTIIDGIGVEDTTVEISRSDREYYFSIQTEKNYSLLIGRRGETLNSIQYLVRLAANHGRDDEKAARISINVGDYRQRRERTLREMAKKDARRVRKYGRNVTLNPMNPAERRIIHTTVAEIEGVQSYSVGEDADRRVVIALEDGVKPLNGNSRGRNDRGRNDRRGGRNDRRGGGRGRNDRPQSPSRPPRKDAEGILYGRIDIPAAVEHKDKPAEVDLGDTFDSPFVENPMAPETPAVEETVIVTEETEVVVEETTEE